MKLSKFIQHIASTNEETKKYDKYQEYLSDFKWVFKTDGDMLVDFRNGNSNPNGWMVMNDSNEDLYLVIE